MTWGLEEKGKEEAGEKGVKGGGGFSICSSPVHGSSSVIVFMDGTQEALSC